MKFIFTGKNIEVTEAMKEKVRKKMKKFEKFFNEDTEINTTFRTEKNKHIIEAAILHNGNTYRAEEKNDDMYTSIDKIVDVLDGQIKKGKEKLSKKNKTESVKTSFPVLKSSKQSKKITEVRKYSVKPMTLEEATMQLNLGNEWFIMFANSATKQVNMLYRLEGGGYGLVESEE
ncbi:MAG: ribosome hibernation-promoting factor, HPF/YfiA family [Ignavibacteriales bacterium]